MAHRFLGIDHLGIAVSDLERAVHTYATVLGLAGGEREVLEERGIEVAFFETHAQAPGAGERIEILGALRADSEISGFLKKRGEGIHHICLAVEDIEASVAHMRKEGATIVGDGVQRGAHGTRVAFLHPKSTHGVLVELVERGSPHERGP